MFKLCAYAMHSIRHFRILINASRVNQWKVKTLSTLYTSLKRIQVYIYIFISRSILSQLHRLNNQTDVFPNFYSFFPFEKNIIHRNEFTRKLNFYGMEPDKRNELIFKNLEE